MSAAAKTGTKKSGSSVWEKPERNRAGKSDGGTKNEDPVAPGLRHTTMRVFGVGGG